MKLLAPLKINGMARQLLADPGDLEWSEDGARRSYRHFAHSFDGTGGASAPSNSLKVDMPMPGYAIAGQSKQERAHA